ncbi:tetratricopeptide repeat protein [candidate division WOR-3 bacterium]|uniref:Tetratricopeptide repeat protein n=1 Tax=candidate division WOR-3 bacterium TaxID=2052148 RepID=A0A9D5QCW1_UNCW3|nr:tetratricopeptide repeat protein [candidate division WOR-3 bacterium]MBD3364467.1 tetratricopeptide repeat protein [candidate division WOR-3 bacterium]
MKRGEKNKATRLAGEGLRFDPCPHEAAELNYILGMLAFGEYRFEDALPYARQALCFAREDKDYYTICKCALFVGQITARLNRYRDARRAWKEALIEAKKNDNLRVQGIIHFNVSILEHKRGKYEYALKLLEKCEKCADTVGDFRMQARCYGRMVSAYLDLDQINKAHESGEKMEKIAERMEIPRLKANTYFHKGYLYMKLERYENAVPFFEKSAAIYEDLGDVNSHITMVINVASAYMGAGNLDKSESLLRKAERLSKETSSIKVKVRLLLLKAELSASHRNVSQTHQYYEKALTLAEKTQSDEHFVSFHKNLKITIERKLRFNLPGLADLLKRARRSYKTFGLYAQDREAKEWLERMKPEP